jgi:hypothetical protein
MWRDRLCRLPGVQECRRSRNAVSIDRELGLVTHQLYHVGQVYSNRSDRLSSKLAGLHRDVLVDTSLTRRVG